MIVTENHILVHTFRRGAKELDVLAFEEAFGSLHVRSWINSYSYDYSTYSVMPSDTFWILWFFIVIIGTNIYLSLYETLATFDNLIYVL